MFMNQNNFDFIVLLVIYVIETTGVFFFFCVVFAQVYAYHRSLPMPITSYKFGSIDPISGKEIEEENNLFVSSVCWRKRSNMVVAASSNGSIKVLQLV